MKKVIALLVVASIAMPAVASYYVPGDFNGWNTSANEMMEVSPGVFEVTITDFNIGRSEFKITDGSNWYPSGGNSWVITDDGTATVTFTADSIGDGWSPDVNRIGLDEDPGTWTAVGSFQGWDNANPATAMTDMGGGLYMYEVIGLAPGTHYWKAVNTGSWDSISWDERSVNSQNTEFVIDGVNTGAELWVDALGGAVKVVYTPEPATLALLAMGGLVIIRRR